MTEANKDPSQLEQEIKEAIKGLESRDNQVGPDKTYTQIEGRPNPVVESLRESHSRLERQHRRLLGLLTTLFVILGVTLVLLALQTNRVAELEQVAPPVVKQMDGAEEIHDISFAVKSVNYDQTSKRYGMLVSVENKGQHDFVMNVRAITLISPSGTLYRTNLAQSTLSPEFFGQRIAPQGMQSATLIFNDVVQEQGQWTLKVSNVSDSFHYIWDYMITLP